ncbi:VPLPA-CTERM sorting domain-containing protein [Litoreibacter sp.]|nr:VPLPA-CTERM sorting domain-containing protein [Litoreibacter sp.]
MKFIHIAAFAASALFTASSMASAATTFNLGCGGGVTCDSSSSSVSNVNSLPSSFSETMGDLTVTATAKSLIGVTVVASNGDGSADYSGASGLATGKIGRFVGGAGVFSSAGDAHTVDSNGPFELIELTFNKAVSITDLAFGYFFGGNDTFGLMTDLGDDGLFVGIDRLGAQTNVANNVSTGSTLFSKTWGVVTYNSSASFKLSAVTVEKAPVPAVPLPAGGLLLLSGLAGLGFARRRK